MKRRVKIRVASFALAAAVALTAWGVWGSVNVGRLTRERDAVQQRSLLRVTEALGEIDSALQKAEWAGSSALLGSLSAEIRSQASGAKAGLSALAAGERTLTNTYRFLSQVGDYTAALHKKAERNERITGEERQNLSMLQDRAAELSRRFSYMTELLDAGSFSFDEIRQALWSMDDGSEQTVSFPDAAGEAEDGMDDYPTLIYDGPFSDHIFSKESALLAAEEPVSEAAAKRIAAAALDVGEAYLTTHPDSEGKLASYHFSANGRRVSVTKRGGWVLSLLADYEAGPVKLSQAEAVTAASQYLTKLGYRDMVSTYAFTEDGVCCFNFAGTLAGWTLYPDLVKVGVSLSDGSVVSMDAADYLMNHVERMAPVPAVTEPEAKRALNPALKVKRTDLALIPTPGGGEVFAYEFLCETPAGTDVLVYVDAATGQEADLLLLLYADGGTLTK